MSPGHGAGRRKPSGVRHAQLFKCLGGTMSWQRLRLQRVAFRNNLKKIYWSFVGVWTHKQPSPCQSSLCPLSKCFLRAREKKREIPLQKRPINLQTSALFCMWHDSSCVWGSEESSIVRYRADVNTPLTFAALFQPDLGRRKYLHNNLNFQNVKCVWCVQKALSGLTRGQSVSWGALGSVLQEDAGEGTVERRWRKCVWWPVSSPAKSTKLNTNLLTNWSHFINVLGRKAPISSEGKKAIRMSCRL